jgi:integrase
MLRVGRPRSQNKDLPLGVRLVAGRYYVRPVNEAMRQVFARAFPGRATAPLGADKAEMRQRWVALFCAPAGPVPTGGTVSEILERFERDELGRLDPKTGRPFFAPSTQANYLGAIKRLHAEFGATRYAGSAEEAVGGPFLRTMHVYAYLRRHERTRPYGANQDIVCLAAAFRAAVLWGLTEYSPCDQIRYHASTRRELLPTNDAYLAVYQHASPVLQCLMDLAQMTGARRGSLVAITLADIRPDGLRVVSNKTKRGRQPKETIYEWSDDLRACVERAKALRAGRRTGGRVEAMHLFLTRQGRPWSKSALDGMWSRTVQRAGIDRAKFHFHDIRAANASEGSDDLEAMKRLGHADLRTTRTVYRRRADVVKPLPVMSRSRKGK